MFENFSHCVVVGKRGTITIPSLIRKELGIDEGDALKVQILKDGTMTIEKIKRVDK